MPDTVESRALPDFCAAVICQYPSTWPPTEDQLARAFLAHFGIARLSSYEGLVTWCGEVGIAFSNAELPHDLHGFNYWHEKNMSIVMPPIGGCFISREHTLLHELRELLEGVFEHLGHPIGDRDSRESHAEQFAAYVRMAVSLEFSKDYFAMARGVRDPLGRACAYGLVGAVTVVLVLSSIGVRQLEAQFDAQRRYPTT